jgi:hypothetical protein
MALLLGDGFGLYNTPSGALQVKGWTAGVLVISTKFSVGRVSTSRQVALFGPANSETLVQTLATFSGATSIIGVAGKLGTAITGTGEKPDICSMGVGGSHVRLAFFGAADGPHLYLYKDSTMVADLGLFAQGSWYYMEMKVVWATSATVVVRVDGAERHNAAMTLAAPTAGLTVGVRNAFMDASLRNIAFTDLVVMDGSGSTFNDFQGDVTIETLFPTADGATSGWTPSTGSNHSALVDEAPFHNGDTDYVSTATVNATDTYVMQNLTSSALSPVIAVRPFVVARKESAAVMGLAAVVRSAGTNYAGTASDLPNTLAYTAVHDLLLTDPATGTAWTRAAVDAMEVGPAKTA